MKKVTEKLKIIIKRYYFVIKREALNYNWQMSKRRKFSRFKAVVQFSY